MAWGAALACLLCTVATARAAELAVRWQYDLADYSRRQVYVPVGGGADASPVPDLARIGTPTAWTQASQDGRQAFAMDGDLETYSVVPDSAPHARDLPQDLGVQWPEPRRVSEVQITFFSPAFAPARDGQQLQVWRDGEWTGTGAEPVEAGNAAWKYQFAPVETDRVRLLVTRLRRDRIAVRSFEVFSLPVEGRRLTSRVAATPTSIRFLGPTAPGMRVVLIGAGRTLTLLSGRGALANELQMPERVLDVDLGDLDADGLPEIVILGEREVLCTDAGGKSRWQATYLPTDAAQPGPGARAAMVTLKAADGSGRVMVRGADLLALDAAGRPLWRLPCAAGAFLAPLAMADAGARLLVGGPGVLQVVGEDGRLTGEVRPQPGDAFSAAPIALPPADGHDARLAFGTRQGQVLCLDRSLGMTWSASLAGEVTALGSMYTAGRRLVLAATSDGGLTGLSNIGAIVWSTRLTAPVRLIEVVLLRPDAPCAIAATDDGVVTVIDAAGAILATCDLGNPAVRLATDDLTGDGLPEVVAVTADSRVALLQYSP